MSPIFESRAGHALPSIVPQPRSIDLFCGAGGLSLGFELQGFKPVWANDLDPSAAQTYEANFGVPCITGDLVNIVENRPFDIPRAEIVIGGPPCQGFSLLNKARDGDPRRHLWIPFLDVVHLSGAVAFVMENVPQIIGTPEHDAIIDRAEEMGFCVTSAKLLAADYGVPQRRLRAFVVGCKLSNPKQYFPPKRTHHNPEARSQPQLIYEEESLPWRTVRDAIADLPEPVGTQIRTCEPPLDLHFGRTPTAESMARYRAIPAEGMNREDLLRNAPELTPRCWVNKTGGTDLFGRLWWDRPAYTIRTEFFKPEKGRYLHPQQHRPITHREAARLQSFPDSFVFLGSKIQIARQIGNAVPPLLAYAVAASVKLILPEALVAANP